MSSIDTAGTLLIAGISEASKRTLTHRAVKELSVVVPACNEEAGIRKTLTEYISVLKHVCDTWELIVVDDGSTDGTHDILREMQIENPELNVISYTPNRGYAYALRTGFSAASMDPVFYTDADSQFDLEEIPLLYDEIGEADMVAGYRRDRRDPATRILYSRIYNLLQRMLLGIRARDINCAFKMFRQDFLRHTLLTSEHFLIDAELFARAGRLGARVIQVPVTHRFREEGTSSIRLKTFWETFREMLRLRGEILRWKPEN